MSLTENTINQLKYVYDSFNMKKAMLERLENVVKAYELAKKTDDEKNEDDTVIDELKENKKKEVESIFKNTKMLFIILSNLMRIHIMKVDDEKYKKVGDKKIEFPSSIERLILAIGCYNDAFNIDMREMLFNLIESDSFGDMYRISKIPVNMYPFVINEEFGLDDLKKDYEEFSRHVRNIACEILEVNTDFEEASFIEVV